MMTRKYITSFSGEHRFLSNFYPCPTISYGGMGWPTVEHAYQAMKTEDIAWRTRILNCEKPGQAKRLGQKVPMRSDWEEIKTDVMRRLLELKFERDPLRNKLLATGDAELIEGNHWGDTYWGQCPVGTGMNVLGKLLMEVRANL